jgi:hypothetical protein
MKPVVELFPCPERLSHTVIPFLQITLCNEHEIDLGYFEQEARVFEIGFGTH